MALLPHSTPTPVIKFIAMLEAACAETILLREACHLVSTPFRWFNKILTARKGWQVLKGGARESETDGKDFQSGPLKQAHMPSLK